MTKPSKEKGLRFILHKLRIMVNENEEGEKLPIDEAIKREIKDIDQAHTDIREHFLKLVPNAADMSDTIWDSIQCALDDIVLRNQEELERMQKVISEKDEVILKAVEKLKNFEISRSNKIELKLNKQWSDLIQHLLESVDNIKEGMSGLMRQYDTILEKLNDENKEIKKERKNEPEQFARQIEEASEEKEVEFKEQDSEEKEELII